MTLVQAAYAGRLRRQVLGRPVPAHVGLIMDGNRRWAVSEGLPSARHGHDSGARHVPNVLGWCSAVGIRHVTLYLCSADNLARRDDAEVAALMGIFEDVLVDLLDRLPWQVNLSGQLDLLPASTAMAFKSLTRRSPTLTDGQVTLAIGYSGRREIVEAIRSALLAAAGRGERPAELAARLRESDIARHLWDAGRPDPDLIIRTSGEQRLSDFLLWQGSDSEMAFCEAYWPAFREVDFLRAVRDWGSRRR